MESARREMDASIVMTSAPSLVISASSISVVTAHMLKSAGQLYKENSLHLFADLKQKMFSTFNRFYIVEFNY